MLNSIKVTEAQQILSLIKEQGKLIGKLVRQSRVEKWIAEEDVVREFRLSKKFLQQARKDARIKKYRCLPSGKNFQYQRSEIEALFKEIKN